HHNTQPSSPRLFKPPAIPPVHLQLSPPRRPPIKTTHYPYTTLFRSIRIREERHHMLRVEIPERRHEVSPSVETGAVRAVHLNKTRARHTSVHHSLHTHVSRPITVNVREERHRRPCIRVTKRRRQIPA